MNRITCVGRVAFSCPEERIESLIESIRATDSGQKTNGSIIIIDRVCFQVIEGHIENVTDVLNFLRHLEFIEDINVLESINDIVTGTLADWTLTRVSDGGSPNMNQAIVKLFEEFIHSGKVLEKYTQPSILKMMRSGQDPLEVTWLEQNRIILFSDIVSFSVLTTQIDKQDLWTLVDIYFNSCTKIIMEHGGEVNKFIGDCVMAYFPEDRADNALQACLDILSDIEGFRNLDLEEGPIQLLHCGIAMSFGQVIEGNIGRYKKMDYTVQGDPVNKAAYMEKFTRELPRLLVFTEEVKNITKKDWPFIHLGDLPLKPEMKKAPIYSLDHPVTLKKIEKQELNKIIINRNNPFFDR